MGNPDFAIPTLEAIIQSNHELIGVVSNPPKHMGRGRTLSHTPVGQFSKDNDLTLLEPQSLNSFELKNKLIDLRPDVFVVVAYKILPKDLIDIPKFGSLNLHASLLPKYRGAGPIQWALMNGDKKTGVTIFQIKAKVDAGDILMQKEINILEEDNMLSLGKRLCTHGADLMINVLNKIETNEQVNGLVQDSRLATPAPKIKKDMTIINWNWESKKIHNWIRGLAPYPGMSTIYGGKRLRIFKTSFQSSEVMIPGTIFEARDDRFLIATGEGLLRIYELQIEGKRKMHVSDFLRGNKVKIGERLG